MCYPNCGRLSFWLRYPIAWIKFNWFKWRKRIIIFVFLGLGAWYFAQLRIDNAEAKVDNDIISKSGIDFKAQQFSSETATRTEAKTASARKKINLALKINGYSFFERLARLRMANIQLLHTNKREIFTEGIDVDSKGKTTAIN